MDYEAGRAFQGAFSGGEVIESAKCPSNRYVAAGDVRFADRECRCDDCVPVPDSARRAAVMFFLIAVPRRRRGGNRTSHRTAGHGGRDSRRVYPSQVLRWPMSKSARIRKRAGIDEARLLPRGRKLVFEPKIIFRQVVLSGVSFRRAGCWPAKLFASLALPSSGFAWRTFCLEKTELPSPDLFSEKLR